MDQENERDEPDKASVDALLKVLDTEQARNAIKNGHLDFPGAEVVLRDWNTLPFGAPGECKHKLVSFCQDESAFYDVLAKTLRHLGSSCQGTTKLVLFYISALAGKEWNTAWSLFQPAFEELAKKQGVCIQVHARATKDELIRAMFSIGRETKV